MIVVLYLQFVLPFHTSYVIIPTQPSTATKRFNHQTMILIDCCVSSSSSYSFVYLSINQLLVRGIWRSVKQPAWEIKHPDHCRTRTSQPPQWPWRYHSPSYRRRLLVDVSTYGGERKIWREHSFKRPSHLQKTAWYQSATILRATERENNKTTPSIAVPPPPSKHRCNR